MAAITLLARLRERYAAAITDVVLSGEIGPQGDGYEPSQLDPGAAAAYHRPQIEAFAQAGADMVTAYTMTGTGEAIGIVQAARAVGLPVAVSFTVETDGRLPGGVPLAQAITEADAAGPDYFLVNCAYPAHIEPALAEPGRWRERIIGVRYNASVNSHAELDQATELDVGDPRLLSAAHHRLRPLLPHLSCGAARARARVRGDGPVAGGRSRGGERRLGGSRRSGDRQVGPARLRGAAGHAGDAGSPRGRRGGRGRSGVRRAVRAAAAGRCVSRRAAADAILSAGGCTGAGAVHQFRSPADLGSSA
jgi:hypothetical protein